MSAIFWVTLTDPTTGALVPGQTLSMVFGASPLWGRTGGGAVGSFTEDPTNSGCYQCTLNETNRYTVYVNGSPHDELTDVMILADDVVVKGNVSGQLGSVDGAALVGIADSAGRFTATNVEGALAELAGSGRTTETVKGNATNIVALQAVLASIDNTMLQAVTSAGGIADASAQHTHDSLYYTETEINAWRNTSSGVITGNGITAKQSGGAPTGDILIDSSATSGNNSASDIILRLRPSGSGSAGQVTIDQDGTEYRVITAFDTGDFDYSGTNYGSTIDPSDPSALKRMLLALDSALATLWQQQWPGQETQVWKTIWREVFSETVGTVTTGEALPSTDFDFVYSNSSEAFIKKLWLTETDTNYYDYRLRVQAKVAGGGGGTIYLRHVDSALEASIAVSGSSDTWYTSGVLTLPSSYANPTEWRIVIKGDGTNNLTVYNNMSIQAR